MNEVAFLLRKKVASKSAQTVGLTIQLIGVFVNNCGPRFHAILNDERFTRVIADAVRYFSKRPGHDSKDTTDVALDLIQSWGEAFLPRRREYYFIVDLYFNLRKEGLPFKPQQFDPNRVPIFANDNGGGAIDNTDSILAASLASELALQDEQADRNRHRNNSHQSHSHDRHGRQEEVRCYAMFHLYRVITFIFSHLVVCSITTTRAGRTTHSPAPPPPALPRWCSLCARACSSSRT